MDRTIESVAVLGAGSAGLLSGMAIKRAFPECTVSIVHSPEIPIIGVGESTTVLFPPFLHQSLGLDFNEFFRAVRPSWKLGVRFLWGDPRDSHFNYPFDKCMGYKPRPLRKMPSYYCLTDWDDASRDWALMDRGLSPCFPTGDGEFTVKDSHGYHIENSGFIQYLLTKAPTLGIELVQGVVDQIRQDQSMDVESLVLSDGRRISADLFVDCSGFQSRLLSKAMREPFVSYADSLFCDSAVIGMWKRQRPVYPYTTAETMDHGWCWQIEFIDHVTRGYVFSSQFCKQEEAIKEFREKNPLLGDDLRVVRFRSGRYRNFWVRNVVSIGNASGFVEPLEATALHLVIEQVRLLCRILSESDGRIVPKLQDVANKRYRQLWDEVRDFLAVHYRFNRRADTPFWQHCRANTNLGGATEFVELYQRAGPSTLCGTTLDGGHVFGYDGFMSLLVGQRVPTEYRNELSERDLQLWRAYRDDLKNKISGALPMERALRQLCG